MSINDFRDSIIGKPHSRKPSNYPDSDMGTSQSDKSLIMGTTRFYEEILLSIHNSLVIVYNSEGKHIEVWGSAQTEEQYGIESKNLKGKSIEGFFQKPEAKEIHNQVQKVFKENKALNFKVNIKFPSGDFWFEVNLSPMKETQGKPKTVIGHFYDISEMVAKEKKLLSINEKLSYIIDHAPDGMISTNSKGVVISVNETLTNSSHFQKEDFLGKKFHKLPIFLQGDFEKYQSITKMFLSGQIPEPFEIKWKTKDGKIKWGEVRSGIIPKKGKLAGFQLAISDITERKEIESDLFKSKQAYKIIVENAHEAIYILQDYHIRFCNARTLELANCSMDELLTTSIVDLIHPDDRESAKKRIADRTDGKRKQDRFVYRILDKEGNLKWLENNTILIDWHGQPAILVFATDITDIKTAKDKEKKYLKSLEFLSEKAMEFIEIKADVDIYPILGEKIREIEPDSCILLLSYNYQKNITQIEHSTGPNDLGPQLRKIISDSSTRFNFKINHDLIKNLSFGKIIKYNDGLFELGYNLFPKETYSRIVSELGIGDIYLIGLTWENLVYGSAILFLKRGVKLENPEAVETVVKLGAIALQRRKAEEALRKSEEKYRHIFESYEDIYYRLDMDGDIIEISPSVEKTGGYLPSEVIGKPFSDFFSEKALIKSFTKSLLQDKTIQDKDIKLVQKNGKTMEASITARLLTDSKNNPIGSQGVIRDIGDRKKVEKKFKASEEKFRTLADYTYDWEYWIAPSDEITYMSPSCERISGYTAG